MSANIAANLPIEIVMLILAVLLVLSVAASKISDRFGIPSLLLFLGIGMLAGSEGIGGIYFDDPKIAQAVGFLALAVILFSGGLDTPWQETRKVMKEAWTLATVGVLLTALLLGFAVHLVLKLPIIQAMLLGAIVSSTDAAAVFAVLRSKGVRLRPKMSATLELESGSNDPMAAFLTIGLIQLIQMPGLAWYSLVGLFFIQMLIGVLVGYLAACLLLLLINALRLGYAGLYPVMAFGMVLFAFAAAAILRGSGFLAVYVMGLVLAQSDFLHKNSLSRFFQGVAWLAQILMFLTLGLYVFPSRLSGIVLPGLVLSAVLMFIARPFGVLACLLPFRYSWREKLFISWVGLRGAVPIILATYPLLAGLDESGTYFNIIFFVVLSSVLIQGTSIPWAARRLKVEDDSPQEMSFPLELAPAHAWKGLLRELTIENSSPFAGRAIYELKLPNKYLVVLVGRGDEFLIPNGSLVVQEGDRILGLARDEVHQKVQELSHAPEA